MSVINCSNTTLVLRSFFGILLITIAAIPATAQMATTSDPCDARVHTNALRSEYEFVSGSWANAREDRASFWKSEPVDLPSHKSSILAALLSAVVPGVGEYYVGDQYWRGAIFTGLEIGFWYEQIHYTSRGDDATTAFWAFGDTHWQLSRYAARLNELLVANGFGASADPANHTSINQAEARLDSLGVENFTHRLPFDNRQQYNELISKYKQYTRAWDDAIDDVPEHSPHYQQAADMRADVNYQYQIASYFTWGIILNHVLSAVDAALVAHDHNAHIRVSGEMLQRPLENGTRYYVPTANIRVRF